MDQQTTETVHRWAAYGKDESFDIEVGMAVIGLEGQPIGTVIEVAGFGSTQLHDRAHRGAPKGVTQAQSGTGYLKVDRTDVVGRRDAPALCVPFHGIEGVTAERTVVLNGTVISELRDQADRTRLVSGALQPTQRGRWHRWLPGRRA